MDKILKGKPVADKICEEVKQESERLNSIDISPKIAIVRIGEKKDDISYEKAAIKRMNLCNIKCDTIVFKDDISQNNFVKELERINNDNNIHGILLLRPFPKHIDENIIKNIINPQKDIDCLNPVNVAKLVENDRSGFSPCTPTAAMEILKFYNVDLAGKTATIIGRSMVVGKPMIQLLLNEDVTVTICHSKTPNLRLITSSSDIVIAAMGKAKKIDRTYIKKDAIVIDVGINIDSNGHLCGDVNTDDCIEEVKYITPVPGGVGAVTTAILAKHVIKACKKIKEL